MLLLDMSWQQTAAGILPVWNEAIVVGSTSMCGAQHELSSDIVNTWYGKLCTQIRQRARLSVPLSIWEGAAHLWVACASARETNASMHALTQIRSNNHLMPAAAPGVHTDVCRSCSVCKILNLGHAISHPMAAHYFSWAFGTEQVEHSTHPFRPRTFWPWYDFIFHLRSHHDFFFTGRYSMLWYYELITKLQ